MKYMRKVLILMLLTCLALSAYAGGKETRILDKDDELTLFPMNHTGKYAASIAPSYPVRVECKATYDRNGKSTADIVNYLTSLSTIKGTQYYSQSKKEVTTLFTDACTVDHPRNANRIEDHKLGNPLPQGIDIYGMLEDSRFKDNVYQFSFLFGDNHITLKITNMDNLKYGPIKAIETHCFLVLMNIVLTDNEIQVYNVGFCKPTVLPSFMEKRVNNAITNRIDALFGWFEKGITE